MTPPGSGYPPILQGAPSDAGPDHDRSRAGRRRSTCCRSCRAHGDIPSLGFRFGNVAYSTDLKSLPAGQHRRARRPRYLDRRCAAQEPASEPFQPRGDAGVDRADQAETGDPDRHAYRPGLRDAARKRCRTASSRPLTACSWKPDKRVSPDREYLYFSILSRAILRCRASHLAGSPASIYSIICLMRILLQAAGGYRSGLRLALRPGC